MGGPKAAGGRRTCRTEATAQTAHTSRSLQGSRLLGSSVVDALRTEAAGRPMVAAPRREAGAAAGGLRVGAAAAPRNYPALCLVAPRRLSAREGHGGLGRGGGRHSRAGGTGRLGLYLGG